MQAALSPLSVITPAAWWALLALAAPLLIHLFSRSRGRLVRIGHIDLVRPAQKTQVTEIKLTRWLLLMLRMAIFTLAALILAGLSSAGLNSSSAPTIYLAPAWVMTASQEDIELALDAFKAAPDSRVFLLQPGFPAADLRQIESARQPAYPGNDDFNNAWALLAERLSLEHHGGEVTVFASDYMLQFGSRRATLPRDVDWRITHPGQAPAISNRPTRALIVHDTDRAGDAATISAALATLREHRLPGLLWESMDTSRPGETTFETDWLILLGSSEAVAGHLAGINTATVILSDAGGGTAEESRQLIHLPFFPFTTFRLDQYSRYANSVADEPASSDGTVLATTADGSPVFQEFHNGQARLLKFSSRFDPQWSSITQQPEFPELLLQLMMGTARETDRFANARIDPADLHPDPDVPNASTPLPRRSLQGLLATLLAVLWMMERWLSERKPRENR